MNLQQALEACEELRGGMDAERLSAEFAEKVSDLQQDLEERRAAVLKGLEEGVQVLERTTESLQDLVDMLNTLAKLQIELTVQYVQPLFPKVRFSQLASNSESVSVRWSTILPILRNHRSEH